MPETVADRLRMAANRIRNHFGRLRLCDEQGNVCALGAILNVSQPNNPPAISLLDADCIAVNAAAELHRTLRAMGVLSVESDLDPADVITWWNDVVVESGPDAAAVMERAAAQWEARA